MHTVQSSCRALRNILSMFSTFRNLLDQYVFVYLFRKRNDENFRFFIYFFYLRHNLNTCIPHYCLLTNMTFKLRLYRSQGYEAF